MCSIVAYAMLALLQWYYAKLEELSRDWRSPGVLGLRENKNSKFKQVGWPYWSNLIGNTWFSFTSKLKVHAILEFSYQPSLHSKYIPLGCTITARHHHFVVDPFNWEINMIQNLCWPLNLVQQTVSSELIASLLLSQDSTQNSVKDLDNSLSLQKISTQFQN